MQKCSFLYVKSCVPCTFSSLFIDHERPERLNIKELKVKSLRGIGLQIWRKSFLGRQSDVQNHLHLTFLAKLHDINTGKVMSNAFPTARMHSALNGLFNDSHFLFSNKMSSQIQFETYFESFLSNSQTTFKIPGRTQLRHIIFVTFVIIIRRCSVPGASDVSSFKAAVSFSGPGPVQLIDLLHWAKSTGFETGICLVTLEKSLTCLILMFLQL